MANSVNQPVSRYDGDSITCFPSSNAKDFGKLHTEFNEARYVTRIAKKNFCIKKPSFVATKIEDPATKTPLLNISALWLENTNGNSTTKSMPKESANSVLSHLSIIFMSPLSEKQALVTNIIVLSL